MSTDSSRAVMTRKEAAELLQVDPRLVSRGVDEGKIPHIRLGRRLLILSGPLNRMLNGENGGEFHGI